MGHRRQVELVQVEVPIPHSDPMSQDDQPPLGRELRPQISIVLALHPFVPNMSGRGLGRVVHLLVPFDKCGYRVTSNASIRTTILNSFSGYIFVSYFVLVGLTF